MWDKIDSADVNERGQYFPPGFRGRVRIERSIMKPTRKDGDAFIVTLEVLESNLAEVAVGSRRSWYQSFKDQILGSSAAKEFFCCLAGVNAGVKSEVDAHISPIAARVGMAATGAGNALMGMIVDLETFTKTTNQGKLFTVHKWTPVASVAAQQLAAMKAIAAGTYTPAMVTANVTTQPVPPGTAQLPALPSGWVYQNGVPVHTG
jgi:hypothetical protein